ncbi:MAG: lysophospholipase [Treponema sp.]|jgi:alpha-beta hydrolase superfamily lysophospholipase|nr:lysophospholipase [Treponema sp.]
MDEQFMLQEDAQWFNCDDGGRIFLRRWVSRGFAEKPLAVLHLVHGMSEHGLRYKRLAETLCRAGFEVWAADQRGHGKTADTSVNGEGRGGLRGHCGDGDGFSRVCADIVQLNRLIREERPAIPLFILGHSWGSFIVQECFEKYSGFEGCILSGSRGPGGLNVKLGLPLIAFFTFVRGERRVSSLASLVVNSFYSKPFRPNRTPFDWISRDQEEVDRFLADTLCRVSYTWGFYRDLIKALNRIHRREAVEKIRKDIPVYIFAGTSDPVGEMGKSPTALVETYRSIGVKDLEFVLYPGARHETLNESNREEVTENLLSWLKRHIEPA